MQKLMGNEDPIVTAAKEKQDADEQIKEWQNALKYGDFFYFFSSQHEIVMWAEVLEDPMEDELHGYRYCRCYISTEPNGILGYLHVSVAHKTVSKEIFDLARQCGWPHDEMTFIKFASKAAKLKNPQSSS